MIKAEDIYKLIHADIDRALSRSGIAEIRYLINLLGTFLSE